MKKYVIRRTRVVSDTVEVYANTKNEALSKSKDESLHGLDSNSRWSNSKVLKTCENFDLVELESLAVIALKAAGDDNLYSIDYGTFVENYEVTSNTSDYETRGQVQSAYIDNGEICISLNGDWDIALSDLMQNVQIEVLFDIVNAANSNGINLPSRLSDVKVIYTNKKYTSLSPWTVIDARAVDWVTLRRGKVTIEVNTDELTFNFNRKNW